MFILYRRGFNFSGPIVNVPIIWRAIDELVILFQLTVIESFQVFCNKSAQQEVILEHAAFARLINQPESQFCKMHHLYQHSVPCFALLHCLIFPLFWFGNHDVRPVWRVYDRIGIDLSLGGNVQLVGRSLRGKKFEVMSTFLRNSCTHQHRSIKKFNSVHNEAVRNCKYQISQQFLIYSEHKSFVSNVKLAAANLNF